MKNKDLRDVRERAMKMISERASEGEEPASPEALQQGVLQEQREVCAQGTAQARGSVRDGESERCHGARSRDTFRSWESFWIFLVLGC